jgi:hypothetical protein
VLGLPGIVWVTPLDPDPVPTQRPSRRGHVLRPAAGSELISGGTPMPVRSNRCSN